MRRRTVYADREQVVNTQAFRERVERAADPTERLILQGQLESGIADALCPEVDDEVDRTGRLPDHITIKTPEGFAFYSVYPEMYRAAALRFLRDEQPQACVVIGIRSIGTSLSTVVAEAVKTVFRFTVRPRGHPFERELRLGPGLEQRIRSLENPWFLVVDEGPGLSRSSFLSVATKLEELGVPPGRIVFFPSHDAERKNWRRYKRYVEAFEPERFLPACARDISGGAWRELTGTDVAVHPHHERRKYLHDGRIFKFAGCHFGRSRYERAQRLVDFGPRPCGFNNGFLETEWVEGKPAELTEELLDTMARYLAFLRAEFATDRPVLAAALEQMIEVNTGQRVEAPQEGVVVAGDGRMLPHEWIETRSGYVKTDALDHHDDHFFPGCQDIAWDIAGASVEWSFPRMR